MAKFVPYLSEDRIERDAASLLAELAQARGVILEPPIAIEDIVEKHLKLSVEFNDTHRMFGIPRDPEGDADILGAIIFNEHRIVIDESLDPEENAFKEGRLRFTLAHEGGGHWRLHRRLFAEDPAQAFLFGGPTPPSVVCRSSQAKERIEWQADYYASCLLMPRNLLIAAWRERFGNTNARVLKRKNRWSLPAGVNDDIATAFWSFDRQRDDEALNEFVRPFADKFQVSMVAMRIRLERIGLLHREVPRQLSFNAEG
jgi:Zn-dependent peptidase ImmA (M78 family)